MNILHIVQVAIVFLLMITLLVAAHELGHYLFARLFRMGIHEFALGMGPPKLLVWRRRKTVLDDGSEMETEFTIRPWPIGGFVRIRGMELFEDGSERTIANGFYSRPAWQRLVVLIAGPVFSVLAGIAILAPLYMANGVPRPSMIVGTTDPSYGAGAAGVRVKDELVSVNGKPVAKLYDLRSELDRNGEKPLDLGLLRNGKPLTLRAVPKLSPTPQPVVGADGASTGETKRLPLLGIMFIARLVPVTLPAAVGESFNVALAAGANVTKIFTQPKTAKDNVGGVITMARATDQMVGEGFQEVMGLAALLSISIGIFNLLPIPPLDGGQMLLTIIEMVRGGRRPSLRLQGALVTIGGVLLITMFLGVFILDISRVVQERKAKSETVSGAPAKSIPVVPAKPEKSP